MPGRSRWSGGAPPPIPSSLAPRSVRFRRPSRRRTSSIRLLRSTDAGTITASSDGSLVQFLSRARPRDAPRMVALAALAALAVAIDASEPAPKDSSPRFRLLPPYADPGFVSGPAPPPDKSYLIALAEVIGIDTLVWAIDYSSGKPYAKISLDSIKQNFDKGWIIDTDDFWANSLMHPLHGNLNYNAARSLGLNFYESFGYAFLGSLIWEQFAEIQPPSMNDQVNTPFGGTMLGETLFRMSRLILDSGGYQPGGWRQFFAFLINPAGGVNRLLFGNKYRGELLLP